MKTLTRLTLATALLFAAATAHAEMVRGYLRSNGTYVAPYYRTPANGIVYDNLSYRGYPSQQPGYVSPRSYSPAPAPGSMTSYGTAADTTGFSRTSSRLPFLGGSSSAWQTMPDLGGIRAIGALGQ